MESFLVVLDDVVVTSAGQVSFGEREAWVTIADDDAPPEFTEGGDATRSVAENTPAGTAIGAPIAATDAEADSLTYVLSGNDAGAFAIDSATGQLRTRMPLDFESKATYDALTVTVDDGHSHVDVLSLTVNVTDVNEPPPRPEAPSVTRSLTSPASELDVVWSTPDMTGRPPLTSYDVSYKAVGVSSWTRHPYVGLDTQTVITGLQAGTTYEVTVRAYNEDGASPWSKPGTDSTGTRPEPTQNTPVPPPGTPTPTPTPTPVPPTPTATPAAPPEPTETPLPASTPAVPAPTATPAPSTASTGAGVPTPTPVAVESSTTRATQERDHAAATPAPGPVTAFPTATPVLTPTPAAPAPTATPVVTTPTPTPEAPAPTPAPVATTPTPTVMPTPAPGPADATPTPGPQPLSPGATPTPTPTPESQGSPATGVLPTPGAGAFTETRAMGTTSIDESVFVAVSLLTFFPLLLFIAALMRRKRRSGEENLVTRNSELLLGALGF